MLIKSEIAGVSTRWGPIFWRLVAAELHYALPYKYKLKTTYHGVKGIKSEKF
jgi:hypothetical protein